MKDALKLALEALEDWDSPMALPAIYAIKEALAQDELCSSQEPVAFISPGGHIHYDPYLDSVPLYTAPPKQEPHNFCPRCGKRLFGMAFAAGGVHTCTPPEGGHQ